MIADRHNVVPFESGKSKPFPTQRLAKVGYKSSTDKKTGKEIPPKFPSVCVSIPVLENWSENQAQKLRPYFVQVIHDTQDKIIRSLYESSDGSLSNVGDSEIGIDQCIAYLEAESEGDRLTKDRIVEWFDLNLKDNLTIVICEKLGVSDADDPRVGQHVAGYRALYGSMSKDSGALQEKQIIGLRNALKVCSVDDDIASKLDAKLEKMQNRPKLEDLLELN